MSQHGYRVEWSNDSKRIKSFLEEVDNSFKEPLSSRVNLKNYALKLAGNAKNLFLQIDTHDAGHLAFYIDRERRAVFITSISVKRCYMRAGIGTYFINFLKQFSENKDIDCIKLEADFRSSSLIGFYQKNGFSVTDKKGNVATLTFIIPKSSC